MPPTSTDGFVLIDKPAGVTSHDVVARVRRALDGARTGHTGTLDPFATGLLVVLVGGATRLARFVPAAPKTYEAVVRFGARTSTDDATGDVEERRPLPDEDRVRAAIATLTGEIAQVPPQYSAKQVGGQRAYAMARRGEAVPLTPVPVTVHEWTVLGRDGADWTVRITCGSGTYVRALARDLGARSGSAAHLIALRRTRIARFDVADAIPLAALQSPVPLHPAAEAIAELPRERLAEPDAVSVRHGRAVPATVDGSVAALLDADERLLAVAEREGAWWHPRLVLAGA